VSTSKGDRTATVRSRTDKGLWKIVHLSNRPTWLSAERFGSG
jgi:hypothetical protein